MRNATVSLNYAEVLLTLARRAEEERVEVVLGVAKRGRDVAERGRVLRGSHLEEAFEAELDVRRDGAVRARLHPADAAFGTGVSRAVTLEREACVGAL